MEEIANDHLDPTGTPVAFDDIQIRSLGISGSVIISKPLEGDSRSQALGSDALGGALDKQSVETDYIIELREISEEATRDAEANRSMVWGHSGIEIEIPAAGDGWRQVMLVTDESGLATWRFPLDDDGRADESRGRSTVTFVVPGYAAETTSTENDRGVLGWLGKKVVRVLSFAIDPVVGKAGNLFASNWERKNRPYRIRRIDKDTYNKNDTGVFSPQDWEEIGRGRSLLFVHGTFSRAASAFSALDESFIDEMNDRYSGRVFAFDHKTLSADPTENAAYFAEAMPIGQYLDIDVVCHSRGGLVSRVLAEAKSELPLDGKQLSVNQVVFVASPNRGTVLTDAKYMGDFVDAYTSILSVMPDNAVTDVLESIIAVVKQLAVGVLKGLEGLQSMNPEGTYLQDFLNSGEASSTLYRSIAADFEPDNPRFRPWAKNRLMDKIFKEQNDLVVPTIGVYEANGDEMFPIASENRLDLSGDALVHHGNFFSNERVVAQLRAWLTG